MSDERIIQRRKVNDYDDEVTKGTNQTDEEGTTVIVIGGGAAGLTAAYDLKRRNIPVQVLEANSTIGGRIRKLEGFADFPMDLGAEWIHSDASILDTIVDDSNVKVDLDTIDEETDMYQIYTKDGEWRSDPWETDNELLRFKNSCWFDFFNDFIVPTVTDNIVCNCVVDTIDYSRDNEHGAVHVITKDGRTFCGSQVIVTVGIKILQRNDINFIPCLPRAKRRAIDNVPHESGMKVFFEFSKQFYFDAGFDIYSKSSDGKHGDTFYWNVSTGRDSTKHILGVFIYGEKSLDYIDLDDKAIRNKILADLDRAFDGQASASYVQHFVQNWTRNEPFVRGLYSSYRNGLRPMYTIQRPVERKIFFAGEALPANGHEYGYAHGAALSGRNAVRQVCRVRNGKTVPFNARAWAVHLLSTVCFGLEHRLFFDEND